MSGNKATLQTMWTNVLKVFNDPNPNYDNTGSFLAPEIVVLTVRPTQERIEGKQQFIDWMKTQKDKPRFTPHDGVIFDLHPSENNATTATITGTGTWVDENGTDLLGFTFKCKFTDTWLFTDLKTAGAKPGR